MKITQGQAKELVRSSKGRFFSGCYIKGDGSERVFNGRLGVAYEKKTNRTRKSNPTVQTYWDRRRGQYRSFRWDRLQWVQVNGVRYYVATQTD